MPADKERPVAYGRAGLLLCSRKYRMAGLIQGENEKEAEYNAKIYRQKWDILKELCKVTL